MNRYLVCDERKLKSNAEIGQKHYFSGENGTRALPQVNPPPKASKSINSPA
jgi:hypothetical protein